MKFEEIQWEALKALRFYSESMEGIVVLEFGPRVASLSIPGGENLFMWEPEKYTRGSWNLRGGHRVWFSRPGGDEAEETYFPDNEPCTWERDGDGVTILGAVDPHLQIQRGLSLRPLEGNQIEVENLLINRSEMLFSAGVWALTCTLPKPGCRYVIPVGDGTSWDNFNVVVFRQWAGYGQGGINDDQFQFDEHAMVVEPKGLENKRMVQAHRGIIALVDSERDLTFAKKVEFDPTATYPLNTNIAIYVGPDNFMVEMESMGPEVGLKPGARVSNVERWLLKKGAPTDSKAVETLFD